MNGDSSMNVDDLGQADAKTLTQLGNVLRRQGDLPAAVAAYHQALIAQPSYGTAHAELGFVLLQQQQYPQAILHFVEALAWQPENARLHIGYGNALCGIAQYEQAIEHYQRALLLKPDAPVALYQLAQALRRLNRVEESLPYYQRALEQRPEDKAIRYGYGVALLALGHLSEGFVEYEGRWRRMHPDVAARPWRGEDLSGRTILLYREQGLGDTIQFARYVPKVAEGGGRVILLCQPPLVRLLQTLEGVHQVVDKAEAMPPINYHCSVMSLPYVVQSTWATLPTHVPYLKVPEDACKRLPQAHMGDTLKVGVAWAGHHGTTHDRERSIAFHQFAVLFDSPGVTFYSLQKGEHAEALKQLPDPAAVIDLAPQLADFADTAAYIVQLDLVITVDTSVAHLTGALGKEVWILLPYAADWRWMLEREDSPWYPTARLFRQSRSGDWDSVIARVKQRLS